jgi:translation elongation factor EF-Tu-like GTPase
MKFRPESPLEWILFISFALVIAAIIFLLFAVLISWSSTPARADDQALQGNIEETISIQSTGIEATCGFQITIINGCVVITPEV